MTFAFLTVCPILMLAAIVAWCVRHELREIRKPKQTPPDEGPSVTRRMRP